MRWVHDHPEEYAEIAKLPMNEQNAALREAIGWDPDRIREDYEERMEHGNSVHRPEDEDRVA